MKKELTQEQEQAVHLVRLHNRLEEAVITNNMETYWAIYSVYIKALDEWNKTRKETSCTTLYNLKRFK